ncbi:MULTISPECIES: LysR family transcriptional regulator [Exiguobacterium]|uniref:LysR family transcriptional regulator n=1 Tax=unclassified Exiguobacterium TaxID=2644629 RepID=UPI001BE6E546|nr:MULTISPECIES: LysR family transcriptional regulator [Exiguobacterium]
MKTEWMEAFLVTAETGSLTKASEVLHMTQPALSKQIKSLESALDVSLLHRSAHGVTLTTAGEIVFEESRELLDRIDQMKRRIGTIDERTTLTLGSWPSVAMTYLPRHVSRQATAPDLKLKTAHTTIDLMQGLEERRYDAVLLDDRHHVHPYHTTHLYTENFLLYVHQDDERFTGCTSVAFDQIRDASFLSLPIDCDSTNILKDAFIERGAVYQAENEMEFGSSVLGFIRAGLGIALLPEIFQDGLSPEIKTLPVDGFDVVRELSLVSRDASHHAILLDLLGQSR